MTAAVLVVVVLGGSSPSARDRKVADLLTDGFKKSKGTGTLLTAKAPASGKAPQIIEAHAKGSERCHCPTL